MTSQDWAQGWSWVLVQIRQGLDSRCIRGYHSVVPASVLYMANSLSDAIALWGPCHVLQI